MNNRFIITEEERTEILRLYLTENTEQPKKSIRQENFEYIIKWFKSVENTLYNKGFQDITFDFVGEDIIKDAETKGFARLTHSNREVLGVPIPKWINIRDERELMNLEEYFFNEFKPTKEDIIKFINRDDSFYKKIGSFFYGYLFKRFNLDNRKPINDFLKKNKNDIIETIIVDDSKGFDSYEKTYHELFNIYYKSIDGSPTLKRYVKNIFNKHSLDRKTKK